MNTITLELLRTGGPENQLISVLTPYLAVCGDHEPRTVYLPFNHHDYLLRHKRLRYGLDAQATIPAAEREAELTEIGRALSRIFGEVPGLMASFGKQNGPEFVHLELVFSALELALLPFEAAISPDGCPAPGQILSLQLERPVTMTRRLRRDLGPSTRWNQPARVLFASSGPEAAVPVGQHLEAIEGAFAPIATSGDISELVHYLPDASLASIQRKCAENNYAFVHILAHGKRMETIGGGRFGIALHGRAGDTDVVDGIRLASALRTHRGDGLAQPICVSLAVCDGGNTGEVVSPGGSLLHELHQAGIPLVVGSQFPLSFPGSALMTEVLYTRLVRGDDPRIILHDVRQRLSLLQGYHDWAGLVAYLGTWPDREFQFWRQRVDQARHTAKSTASAIGHADDLTPDLERRIGVALEWLGDLPPVGADGTTAVERAARMEISGWRGTLFQQQADLARRLRKRGGNDPQDVPLGDDERRLLSLALKAFREGASDGSQGTVVEGWAPLHHLAIQYCRLAALLFGRVDEAWLDLAEHSAKTDLYSGKAGLQAWAYGSLIEVALLSVFSENRPKDRLKSDAVKQARGLLLAESGNLQLLSTRRQLERYPALLAAYAGDDPRVGEAAEVAEAVVAVLDRREVPTKPESGRGPGGTPAPSDPE